MSRAASATKSKPAETTGEKNQSETAVDAVHKYNLRERYNWKRLPDETVRYIILSDPDEQKELEDVERREHDLYCHVPISFPQAALGTQVMIPTLEGDEEKLHIPAGTQTSSTFRIKGRGISKRGGSARGDLFVTVDIAVPTKLTREQKDLLTKLASTIETENKPIQKKILERVKEIFS